MKAAFANTQPERAIRPDKMASPGRHRFSSVADPLTNPHLNGHYFRNHPTWHVEYSAWKAVHIHQLLQRTGLQPATVCEVGCGAGEVLRRLQMRMEPHCRFWGYDIAPPAIEMAKQRENDSLHFELADFAAIDTAPTDLMLILEVVDHVEDYLGFLRMLRDRAEWKIFSFSLDITAQAALRDGALLRRREVHSHLHHFNKETALAVLRDTGYQVHQYIYVPSLASSKLARMAKPIRRATFKLAPDLTARMFGGYSLMVLAR